MHKLAFRLVNGSIWRACFESNPQLCGFGTTQEAAVSQLLEKEAAAPIHKESLVDDRNALEIKALVLLIDSLLGPNQDRWVVN